jgi:glycosyltransferase involved in cell wall biosynthesis
MHLTVNESLPIMASDHVRQIECRLLYVVGQLGLGGLERQLFYLIRSMDRRRYKPAVVVWRHSLDDYYSTEFVSLGVPVLRLGKDLSRFAKLKALRRIVSLSHPEVLHSYSFHTNLAAWWAVQGREAIAIGSVQSDFHLECSGTGKLLGRLCARLPASLICNSLTADQSASNADTFFRPRRIYVVRNGVDLDLFSPGPHPKQGYILAVGSLYPLKRWDRLIRAAAFLNSQGLRFRVIHVGSGPLREELERMTKSLHVEHVFKFLGPRQDVHNLLADAAFLVHTSDVEGLPNVVLEAMACGRAVVGTDAGDIPHLVENGKTGFVVPRADQAALTDRVRALLTDHELCRRMGDAARIKAEQEFGLERLQAETLAVYRAEGWKDSLYVRT